MLATSNPPPNYDGLESCVALGGRTAAGSPRCLNANGNVTFFRGGVPGFLCCFMFAFFNSRINAGLK